MKHTPEIEDSTESMNDPSPPRYVMSGFPNKTRGFLVAAAIDALYPNCPCWHDMSAESRSKKKIRKFPFGFAEMLYFVQHKTNLTMDGPNEREVL